MDMLERIKVLLSINNDDDTKDNVLTILLEQAIDTICIYLGIIVEDFPADLNFVAIQMVIVRYNKLGAEGIVNEKIDVLSTTYSYNIDELAPYKGILDNYKALHKDDKDENGEYIYDRHSNNKYNGRFKML